MVWWYIWGSLMTLTPNATLQRITGWVFLIFLLITYIKNQMHTPRNPIQITTLRKNLTYLWQLLLSVLSWYIPGSAGSLYFILYTEMLHLKILEYKALWRVTALALFVGTIYPIAHAGLIHWQYVIPFFAGMYLWGHFGSKHLIHIWNTLAQYIVYVSIFFLGIYLLFS
jgi:uncharacterized membrane protein YfcA